MQITYILYTMPKPNMRNIASNGMNMMKTALRMAPKTTKYTTFVALGELTDNKLTQIKVVAEQSDLVGSRLAETKFTLEELAGLKPKDTGQVNGYSYFIAEKETDINNIIPSIVGSVISKSARTTAQKALLTPLQNSPIPGGSRTSKKTQRRRQKRQNRKTRHI